MRVGQTVGNSRFVPLLFSVGEKKMGAYGQTLHTRFSSYYWSYPLTENIWKEGFSMLYVFNGAHKGNDISLDVVLLDPLEHGLDENYI